MTEEINTNKMDNEEIGDELLEGGIYTLTDEDGNETNFELLGTCQIDDKTYYALIPDTEDAEEYYIFRAEADEDGELMLVTIEDDEEFYSAQDYFDAHMEEIIDFDGEDEGE